MATVTAYTAERMKDIEDASVVNGEIVGDHLILQRFDGSEIDAGNVRGPTGSPGVTEEELDDSLAKATPIAGTIDYMGETSPYPNWLPMTGQVVVDAQTLYPIWWARIPASMKSGAPNAQMPDTRGRFAIGLDTTDADFNAIGEVGGEKVHVLTTGEMPSHTHTQDPHNHGQDPHNHGQNAHNHLQNAHNHEQDPHAHTSEPHVHLHNHTHVTSFGGHSSVVMADPGGDFALGTVPAAGGPGTGVSFALDYAFTVNPNLPYTDGNVDPGTHYVYATNIEETATNIAETASNIANTATNIANTATNQNTGGGAGHNNIPPYVVFLKLVRVA